MNAPTTRGARQYARKKARRELYRLERQTGYPDIDQLGLPTVCRNALYGAGLMVIDDLIKLSPVRLARIRKLGPKGFATVMAALTARGLILQPEWNHDRLPAAYLRALKKPLSGGQS